MIVIVTAKCQGQTLHLWARFQFHKLGKNASVVGGNDDRRQVDGEGRITRTWYDRSPGVSLDVKMGQHWERRDESDRVVRKRELGVHQVQAFDSLKTRQQGGAAFGVNGAPIHESDPQVRHVGQTTAEVNSSIRR